MKSTATANWKGGLKEGHGTVSAKSGIFANSPYSFAQRFETGGGTTPEELVAAAHASCYAMALSGELGKVGLTPDSLDTRATVTVDRVDGAFTVTSSHLEVTARIPNADPEKFQAAANAAKAGCPISKLLKAEITLEAKLGSR